MNTCYDHFKKQKSICRQVEQQSVCIKVIEQQWQTCIKMFTNDFLIKNDRSI